MIKDTKRINKKAEKSNCLQSAFTSLKNKDLSFSKLVRIISLIALGFLSGPANVYSQGMYPQPNNLISNPATNNNYMAKSTAFKQEIARVEITVVRDGKAPLSITEVPRLAKDDILKVRLLEEQVNGVKPDQSNFDWSFLIAFINPGRNSDAEKTVSEEIQFRKRGWYKEYSFTVPYDSQPVFFLYPKPNYRAKILNLINRHQEDIRKIGEKTIELSGAYAKIGSFLNELQAVIYRNQYYGGTYGGTYGSYNSYGNTYGSYGSYGSTGYGATGTGSGTGGFNQNLFMEQAIERLARGFNIQLPNCFNGGGGSYNGGYANPYGSYGSTYGATTTTTGAYNSGYYGGYGGGYGYGGGGGMINDFVGRAQCVAKSVRLEDFDLSVSQMLQQGGILAATQLAQKYPQIAHWINIAAVALDFILKLTKKTPLRIVPTVVSTSGSAPAANLGYQQNFNQPGGAMYQQAPSPTIGPFMSGSGKAGEAVKISLYAEAAPEDNNFVTAYPLVIHKWQANADPEVIGLPMPSLMEPCLHPGQNILRSTDLLNDWMADQFTKDFKLSITSANGFRKEFPLRKNLGLSGWELNITKEDLNFFPKINMTLESVITGTRGFNEIKSPVFPLPLPAAGSWEIAAESQKAFASGGKRTVTLKNQLGSCKCLQTVIYKPSFGGQFVFDINNKENSLLFSEDGTEVSFEVDATNFQPGQGQLELRTYGGEIVNLNINLYPALPNVSNVRIGRKDNKAILTGDRLEQIQAIRINGKRAVIEPNRMIAPSANNMIVPGSAPSGNYQNINPMGVSPQMERAFVFEDPAARQETNSFSIELELDGGRSFQYPKTFNVSPARPALVSRQIREIEAAAAMMPTANKPRSQFALDALPIFPIETSEITLVVQNALTDYDFKIENIEIETRIENSQLNPAELPKINFEVLDWKNMQITFRLNEQLQRLLGGRRLQFRLRDRERGDSDWYTLGKTFARLPENISVKCPAAGNENCQLKGKGIEYIGQVSVDGGKTWRFIDPAAAFVIEPKADGEKTVAIPRYSDKNLLQIRLRDFPMTVGLPVRDYSFVSAGARKN